MIEKTLQEQDFNAINLEIFEKLMGAKRTKLEQGACGLVYKDQVYGRLEGQENFHNLQRWEAGYAGPDFCYDLGWIFAAESALANSELLKFYLQALVKIVCPNWSKLDKDSEVLDFWFSLAHASPCNRATAISMALKAQFRHNLEDIVEEAISLATHMPGQPFLDYVQGLEPPVAEGLLATMYFGRGDHPTFELTLRAVHGSSYDQKALARQMAEKTPLVKYLQDGLAKLKQQ